MTTPHEFFEWLQESPWAHMMNGEEWMFPVVQSLHFIGFSFLIGTIAIGDFRLMGIGMGRLSALDWYTDLRKFTLIGLAMMLITGPLMFSADALQYYRNPTLHFKLEALVVALVFHFLVRKRFLAPETPPVAAKAIGFISLLSWMCVLFGGRMIAFL